MFTQVNDVITCATSDDFDELVDMMDEVFSEKSPHDFRSYLPALYKRDEKHSNCNLIIRLDNKIVATLGIFPIDFHTDNDNFLRIAGIGGVAVHKDYRKLGLMKKLMEAAIKKIKKDNYHLCYLGGQRQRYRYFGFERCGARYRLHINKDNVRHDFPKNLGKAKLLKNIKDNPDLADQIKKLHRTQPTWCKREFSSFKDYINQWNYSPWAIVNTTGEIEAYLLANPNNNTVAEIVGKDINSALTITKLWIEKNGDIDILLPTIPTALLKKLSYICETIQIEPTGNWRIFDWQNTLSSILKLQQRQTLLEKGAVNINISDLDITLKLWVNEADAGCIQTEDTADISASSSKMMAILFGPARPSITANILPTAGILQNWCPLPLHLPLIDHV